MEYQEHGIGFPLQQDAAAAKFPFISSAGGSSYPGKELAFHEPSAPTTLAYPPWQDYKFKLALGRSSLLGVCNADQRQSYGVCSTFGAHVTETYKKHGRAKVLLHPVIAVEEPAVYVNAKQFKGILRRRLARAKAPRERRGGVVSMKRKPYLHESRHLHALRRARGSGGRFLNTRNIVAGELDGDAGSGGGVPTPRSAAAFINSFGSENAGDAPEQAARPVQDAAGDFLSSPRTNEGGRN